MTASRKREFKLPAFLRPRARPPMQPDPPPSSFAHRPVSSTTIATHSTIAPLPSDALRARIQRTRHTPVPDHDQPSDDHCSETPSSSARKPALPSFFGISLARRSSVSDKPSSEPRPKSARKRSFRFASRPSTPKSLHDSPKSIPVPSSPLPLSASPRRRSFGLASSQRSTPKSSSGHLPLPPAPLPRPPGRRHSVASERLPHDSAVALPEEPPHRHTNGTRIKGKDRLPDSDSISKSLPSGHLSTVIDSSTEDDHSLLRIPPLPRIIHTPPTPQRPGEVGIPSTPSTSAEHGKTVPIAHREQVLVSSSTSHPTPSKARFTPRFFSGKPSKDEKANRRTTAASTPVSHIPGPARMTNHRSKLGSFDFERPVSALNREGSQYAKSSLHSLERTISNDGNIRFPHDPSQAESVLSHSGPAHPADASVISFSSVSLQTKSTGKGTGTITPVGQSSSWGRASSRRVLRTSNGTVTFEHPTSVPNSPNPPPFNLPNHTDLSALFSSSQPDIQAKHSRAQSSDGADIRPTFKGKGRSLDLGLGLSWAPSRLREDVLMPGLILKAKQDRNNSADGLDVTKAFESLLSESRFQAFKKYVHRFDAHIIPLEGPTGLLARVERLLRETGLSERERNRLMSEFTNFVETHSE